MMPRTLTAFLKRRLKLRRKWKLINNTGSWQEWPSRIQNSLRRVKIRCLLQKIQLARQKMQFTSRFCQLKKTYLIRSMTKLSKFKLLRKAQNSLSQKASLTLSRNGQWNLPRSTSTNSTSMKQNQSTSSYLLAKDLMPSQGTKHSALSSPCLTCTTLKSICSKPTNKQSLYNQS